MTPMDTKACTAGLELAKTDLWGVKYDIVRKNRQQNHEIGNFVLHKSQDLRWLAEMTIACNEINIRHPQGTEGGDAQLELVKTEVWGANYTFLGQKMAYFGTSSGAVLCHGFCHTCTELSCDALKLSECVKKTFCEVL